uniref:hypothetical protein n=1 Tax=Roseburia sp. TaxID=2049040 RepID=UPI003FF03750
MRQSRDADSSSRTGEPVSQIVVQNGNVVQNVRSDTLSETETREIKNGAQAWNSIGYGHRKFP